MRVLELIDEGENEQRQQRIRDTKAGKKREFKDHIDRWTWQAEDLVEKVKKKFGGIVQLCRTGRVSTTAPK